MAQTSSRVRSLVGDRGFPLSQSDVERIRAGLRTALLTARNPDGGWAYARGKGSRIEPTCWALLALAHSDGREPDVDVLRAWRRQDGWLADVAGVPPNHAFSALAALTLLQTGPTAADAHALGARLVASKGIRARQAREFRQDNSLQGWSWIDGTFSWVEPTAWCLLLLKKIRSRGISRLPGADERIDEGERLLLDRACKVGGWNYGNSNVYGQELWPYVPTTALALLALQDRRDHPVVEKSLQQLQRDVLTERSAVALALSIVCLRVYGVAPDMLVGDLRDLSTHPASGVGPSDDVLGLAMTLYAFVDARAAASFTL